MDTTTKIIMLFKSKTAIQSSITVTATIINGLLGMIFYIFVARILGPAEFGILAVSIAMITLIADIASVGTDTGIIRFVGKYIHEDKDRAYRFLKLGLWTKLLSFFIVLLVGWFVMPIVAVSVFGKSELIVPLQLSLIGVGAALLFSFISHAIQAHQKYTHWAILNIGQNGLRLIMIVVLVALGFVDLESILVTYMVIPLFGFLVGLLLIPNFLFARREFSVASEFFHYNKWIAAGGLIAAIGDRIDVFVGAKYLQNNQVGVYAAAKQLTAVVPQLIFAIATVVAPKLASMRDDNEAKKYLIKIQLMVLGLSICGLLSIPISFWAIPYFYGVEYVGSIVPFCILLVAQLFFLLSLPSHQAIFYYFAKPKVFVFISVVNILLISSLSLYLIPTIGVVGAALAILIGSIFNFLVPGLWVLNHFKRT